MGGDEFISSVRWLPVARRDDDDDEPCLPPRLPLSSAGLLLPPPLVRLVGAGGAVGGVSSGAHPSAPAPSTQHPCGHTLGRGGVLWSSRWERAHPGYSKDVWLVYGFLLGD
jgi:hypothetical protein